MSLLRRYCKNFYIVYDGDEAGSKASLRAAAKIISQNGQVRIVSLPAGEDPDSFLLKKGNAAFEDILENSPTYLQYLKNSMSLGEAMQTLVEVASSIPNRLDQFVFTRKVAENFGVEESVFSSQLKKRRVYPNNDQKVKKNIPDLGLEEQLLLSAMLSDKQTTDLAVKSLTKQDFSIDEYKEVFSELQEALQQGELNFNALACQSKYPETFNELIYRAQSSQVIDVKQLLKGFEIKKKMKEFAELDQKLSELLANNSNPSALKEIFEQKKRAKKVLIELGYSKTKV